MYIWICIPHMYRIYIHLIHVHINVYMYQYIYIYPFPSLSIYFYRCLQLHITTNQIGIYMYMCVYVTSWQIDTWLLCKDTAKDIAGCDMTVPSAILEVLEVLWHTATYCNTLQHTATHCNTLQDAAARCNTLQHTATHVCAKRDLRSAWGHVTHCNTL